MAEKNEDEPTPAEDIVVTKYKMAGDMINGILKEVTEKCKAGVAVLSICEFGDNRILEDTGKVFKKDKEMRKGLAFPTCISVNNCICHFSPLRSEPECLLADGDLVKIDMGAHIDGFIAVVAHSLVIGATAENKAKGKKADAIIAAHLAGEAALRLVKPGNENDGVTDIIGKVAEQYKCKPIEGMLSHQLKKHVIDGEKAIIQNPTEAQRKEHQKCEFEMYEVYGIDILISSGEGKELCAIIPLKSTTESCGGLQRTQAVFQPMDLRVKPGGPLAETLFEHGLRRELDGQGRDLDTKTTVFKKKDIIYQLKMKASRQFLSEVDKKFGLMPFTLRLMEDETKAKMGVKECVKHDLMQPFGVLYERDSEVVAQFKFTIILMPNGPLKLTGLPFDINQYESEFSIVDEEVKTILASSASRKAHKKKKKKATQQIMNEAEGACGGE